MILVKNKWLKWVVAISLAIAITILTAPINTDEHTNFIFSFMLYGIPTFFINLLLIGQLEKENNFKNLLKPKIPVIIVFTIFLFIIRIGYGWMGMPIGGGNFVSSFPYPYKSGTVTGSSQINVKTVFTPTQYYWWGYVLNIYFWIALYIVIAAKCNEEEQKRKKNINQPITKSPNMHQEQ